MRMLLLSLILSHGALAAPIVIAGENIQTNNIEKQELRRVFLGTDTTLGEVHIELVLPKSTAAVLSDFCEQSLKMNTDQFQRYWLRRVLTGKSIAPRQLTTAQTIDFIKAHPNAIGLIESSEALELMGLNVIK